MTVLTSREEDRVKDKAQGNGGDRDHQGSAQNLCMQKMSQFPLLRNILC